MPCLALVSILAGGLCGQADETKDEEIMNWPANPPAHWTRYHLAHPDPQVGFFPAAPNPAFYYKGRYHLHYLYPDTGGLGMPMFRARIWCIGNGMRPC